MRQLPLVLLVVVLALGLGWYFGSRSPRVAPQAPANAAATTPAPPAAAAVPPRDLLAAPSPAAEPRDAAELFQAEPRAKREFPQPVLAFEARNDGLPSSGTWIGYPFLHDFTGDGRADLIASNREEDGYSAWESATDGGWLVRNVGPLVGDVAGEGLPRDMAYGPAAAADFDADGHDDLVLSAHSDAVRVYLNDGHMRWTRSPGTVDHTFLLLDVDTGDLDGDAFPDVAAIAHFGGGAVLFRGDGKGGLKRLPESAQILPQRAMGKDVELGDLDGDGIDDLVIASNVGLKAILVRPGATASFEDISAGLPNPAIGNSIYTAAIGRFLPGDRPQIAAAIVADPLAKGDDRDYVGVWAYDAEKNVWRHADSGLPREEAYRDLAAADFDKDGDLDLLTISIESGAVIQLNDGKGHFTPKGRLEGAYGKGRSTVGDVDGDGWIDVVVAIPATKEDPAPGRVRCYRNRPEIWK